MSGSSRRCCLEDLFVNQRLLVLFMKFHMACYQSGSIHGDALRYSCGYMYRSGDVDARVDPELRWARGPSTGNDRGGAPEARVNK